MKGGQDRGLNQTMWHVHFCSLYVFFFLLSSSSLLCPNVKMWLSVNRDNIVRHDSIYFLLWVVGWHMVYVCNML